MQTLDDMLTEVFERGLRNGMESLTASERELFLVQDFILEFEMNGLSGYLYNRLPDIETIAQAALSMRHLGANKLAVLVEEAAKLFQNYKEPDAGASWSEVLIKYDPQGALQQLEAKINELAGYGLPSD